MLLSLSFTNHASIISHLYLSTYFSLKLTAVLKKYRQYEPDLLGVNWANVGASLAVIGRSLFLKHSVYIHYFSRHHCNLKKLIQLPKGALPYEGAAGTLPWTTGASAQATASWLLTLSFSSRQPWPSTSVCWAGALPEWPCYAWCHGTSGQWVPAFQPISLLLSWHVVEPPT